MVRCVIALLVLSRIKAQPDVIKCSVELLLHTVENDSSLLRRALLSQASTNCTFLNLLIRMLHSTDGDTAINNILFDVFRLLLDSDLLEQVNFTRILVNFQLN